MYASQGLQPFAAQPFYATTRPGRSASASTTGSSSPSSRSSSATRSIRAVRPEPHAVGQHPVYTSSIDGILERACAASTTSLVSLSLDSVRADTRPAAFSTREAREERAEFGGALDVLEPRPEDTVGWWGVGEVLESVALERELIA